MKIKTLRSGVLSFGENRLEFSHKDVGTHSLRSVFTWKSSYPGCTQKKLWSWGDSSEKKSPLYSGTSEWYKKSHQWHHYHHPHHIKISWQKIHPLQPRAVRHAQLQATFKEEEHQIQHLSLSLPDINAPQGSNTHTTCPETHKNMSSDMAKLFIYSLGISTNITRIPGIKGKFLINISW